MPGVLVVCPVHGLVENSQFANVSDGATIVTVGGVAYCPVCGRSAEVADGSYRADYRGGVSVDLKLSPSQRQALRSALKRAEQGRRKGEDAESIARHLEDTVVEVVPAASSVIEKFSGNKGMAAAAWLGVLISLITLLLQVTTDSGISEQELQQILDETVRAVQSEHELGEELPPLPSVPERGAAKPPTVTEIPTPETH